MQMVTAETRRPKRPMAEDRGGPRWLWLTIPIVKVVKAPEGDPRDWDAISNGADDIDRGLRQAPA